MKIRVLLAGVAVLFSASQAEAAVTTLFGNSPTGVQTLDTDVAHNINAFTQGWFDDTGHHEARNNNYIVGSDSGVSYRDYFSFDSLLGITSATITVGNDPDVGLTLGAATSVTWTLYDLSSDIDTNQTYDGATDIYEDLGTGVIYGSATVFGPTDHVTVQLNQAGVVALNAAGLTGSAFNFGGALTFNAGPGPGVPEPATWVLMLGGFGMAGVALRRRRPAVLDLRANRKAVGPVATAGPYPIQGSA